MNVVGMAPKQGRPVGCWLIGRYEVKSTQTQLHQSVKVSAIQLQRQNFATDEAGKVFIATSAVLLAFNCIDALAPRVLCLRPLLIFAETAIFI